MQFRLQQAPLLFLVLTLGAALCPAVERDALAIDANIQARHLPYLTIIDPIFASAQSDQIVGYSRCGDSAIWTGHYLAAEAFRYRVTRDPQALENTRRALAGIKGLADVTGTNVLARCMVPINSPYAAGIASEEAQHGVFTNASAGWIWIGNTSRDQYAGVMFGLGVAYDLIDDTGVRNSITDLTTRLLDFLLGHAWTVVMPDGSVSTTFLGRQDQILSLLQVGRRVNPGHFGLKYAESRLLAPEMLAPIGVEVTSDESYYKFNLDVINFYNLIRLESSSWSDVYRSAYGLVRNHTAEHQNAFFDVVDRALRGPNPARDAEILQLLEQWLQRPRRDLSVDLSSAVTVCGDHACQPIPVPLRVPTDFLWQRSPFQLAGGGSGVIESAGIDYILPYWMARYYGVIQAFAVQSAAAGIPQVAADSLASTFGSNLASQTAQANSLPLPTNLGGVTLAVRDAAGVQRTAPLLYVSPGQINFLVPQGTAAGSAAFTISNGTQTLSATGTVQTVAPSLFSADGTGTGPAAATAVRTQVFDPQIQSPVPVVRCDNSGCQTVPIDLGVDTPVYLTLYGTGIRGRSSLAGVTATVNGISVPVLYAGAQGTFAGLDQVNVPLTLNLRGSGESNVVLTVDGQSSNVVTVNIK